MRIRNTQQDHFENFAKRYQTALADTIFKKEHGPQCQQPASIPVGDHLFTTPLKQDFSDSEHDCHGQAVYKSAQPSMELASSQIKAIGNGLDLTLI